MSRTMNDKDLEQFKTHVTKLAKGLKSEADLSDLTQQLMKWLKAELRQEALERPSLHRERP